LRHIGPVLLGLRSSVGAEVQDAVAEPRRERDQWKEAEQRRRVQLAAPLLAADLAIVDMPVNPLAQQDGHLTVPVGEHEVELCA
jgi:hypothetical protein